MTPPHTASRFVIVPPIERPSGKEIKAWRNKENITQPMLAEMCAVTTRTVARWERGDMLPSRMLRLALWYWDSKL